MKVLYTSFVNGNVRALRQEVVDTGDLSLLAYVAAEGGIAESDLATGPSNPDTWLHNEYGLFINDYHSDLIESWVYIS